MRSKENLISAMEFMMARRNMKERVMPAKIFGRGLVFCDFESGICAVEGSGEFV